MLPLLLLMLATCVDVFIARVVAVVAIDVLRHGVVDGVVDVVEISVAAALILLMLILWHLLLCG